jgi:hypothetical protein
MRTATALAELHAIGLPAALAEGETPYHVLEPHERAFVDLLVKIFHGADYNAQWDDKVKLYLRDAYNPAINTGGVLLFEKYFVSEDRTQFIHSVGARLAFCRVIEAVRGIKAHPVRGWVARSRFVGRGFVKLLSAALIDDINALVAAPNADISQKIRGLIETFIRRELTNNAKRRTTVYDPDMDEAHDLNAVAADLGYSFEDARQLLEREAADTAREVTGRARAELRPVIEPPAPVVVIEDQTLLRLQHRYAERLTSTTLPAEGLKDAEQARAARRLIATYQNLRQRHVDRGLEPPPKDARVTEAERLATAFYRQPKTAKLAM